MNLVSFIEFIQIPTIRPFLVLTLGHQGFNNKMENISRGLINEAQVSIFLVTNFTTRKSEVLEKWMNNRYLSVFPKVFVSQVSHRSWTIVHSRLEYLCC